MPRSLWLIPAVVVSSSMVVLAQAPAGLQMPSPTMLVGQETGGQRVEWAGSSSTIQQALDAQSAGGIVELAAGHYLLDAPIRIPEGVTLSGVWAGPHHARLNHGTIFEVYAGEGAEDSPPLVSLLPSTTIRGITFYYPRQRIPGTLAYPWTIQGQGMHNNVIDCTFVNPYKAMDFGTNANELHYVRNCFGCPLKIGVHVDKCTDIGRIENVHFNPHYWARAEVPGIPSWPDLSRYLFENLVAFEFGRSDWEYVLNTFCYGGKVGYRFFRSDTGRGPGTTNGNFLGIGADWCDRALLIEHCQRAGLLITNGEFVGGKGAAAIMEVTHANSGPVQLNNCAFWGPADRCALTDGSGLVSFQQCNFVNHGGRTGIHTVEARGGNLSIQNCHFGLDHPAVLLHEKVLTANIIGNWFVKQPQLDNRSQGTVQHASNIWPGRTMHRPDRTAAASNASQPAGPQ